MLQWRYRIESVLDVPPEAFDPPPRVDSAVVRMEPLPPNPATVDAALLSELVHRGVLAAPQDPAPHAGPLDRAAQGIDRHFDLQRRAEEVPVAGIPGAGQNAGTGRKPLAGSGSAGPPQGYPPRGPLKSGHAWTAKRAALRSER